ncbi:MAG: cupin domain-containing protein [Oscillospiraceae bacterium]|jgi:mannose-6-phosphate isomerase-like protein (cupin superfamily)
MVRKSDQKIVEHKEAPFQGIGSISVASLLNGPEEMSQKGRVFAHTTVYPNCSIGFHIHEGDSETYYIIRGTGRYNDNGTIIEVTAGDVTYTAPGEGHGIECISEEPLEMIALILYQ